MRRRGIERSRKYARNLRTREQRGMIKRQGSEADCNGCGNRGPVARKDPQTPVAEKCTDTLSHLNLAKRELGDAITADHEKQMYAPPTFTSEHGEPAKSHRSGLANPSG